MEGIFFHAGFAMMLALKRRGKMVGEQFEYIMRDESSHLNFGVGLINTIREENPSVWTDAFEAEIDERYGTENPFPWMSEAVDLNREANVFERQVTEYQSGGRWTGSFSDRLETSLRIDRATRLRPESAPTRASPRSGT